MLEIDGSFGEGGGQILRTSLTLSLITGKPFRLRKIRAGRMPKPGLQPQHLASVRAAGRIGGAKMVGDSLGSSELAFEPGAILPGNYHFPIGTAGATGLLLHTVYLPLMWKQDRPSTVTIEGGTHVKTSPCFHFLDITWRAWMEKLGLKITLDLDRPGFYPRGGGRIVAHLQPTDRIQGVHCNKCPTLTTVTGFSAVAGLPEHIAKRQARRAVEQLRREKIRAELAEENWSGGPGSVLGLVFPETPVATFFYGLGERGKSAEKVADEAVHQAIPFLRSGAPVDLHSADQLVLPLALSDEGSEFRVAEVTMHLTTNIAVIRMFLDRDITCKGEVGHPGTVRIAPKLY